MAAQTDAADHRIDAAGRTWSTPTGVYPWVGLVLVAAMLLQPLLLMPFLDGAQQGRLTAATDMSLVLVDFAVFGAAVMLKYEWRLSDNPATGWLSAVLAVWAVHSLPFSLLAVAGSSYGASATTNGATSILVRALAVLMLMAGLNGRGRLRNPILLGSAIGIVAAGIRLALVVTGGDPVMAAGPAASPLVESVVLLLSAVIVVQLLHASTVPTWARTPFAVGAGLLSAVASYPGLPGAGSVTVAQLLLLVLGASLVLSTSVALLRTSFRANSRWLVSLAHRAAAAEAAVRHGRERIHELNATIAGVTQASRLLLREGGPTGTKRARLQSLVDAEMARLERMLTERSEQAPAPFSVDDVLRPLVSLQRTLGQPVRWVPSGCRAVGRPDDLGEVVHNLLVNASRHAPGALTTVTSCLDGDTVHITVADTGPGIDPALGHDLFEWGSRRAGSPGQGIGLQLARRLMREQQGDLRIEDSGNRPGAEFVISIPAAPSATNIYPPLSSSSVDDDDFAFLGDEDDVITA